MAVFVCAPWPGASGLRSRSRSVQPNGASPMLEALGPLIPCSVFAPPALTGLQGRIRPHRRGAMREARGGGGGGEEAGGSSCWYKCNRRNMPQLARLVTWNVRGSMQWNQMVGS